MIYTTGDLHGDLKEFKKRKLHRLKKGDTLIVCGDFGFVFNNSEEEIKKRKWLSKRGFKILFVDGAHDNHAIIDSFETVSLFGAQAKAIDDNIYCLVRGEVYLIEGKTFFAFGSGLSENYLMKEDPDALYILPSMEEMRHGSESLKKYNDEIDYIITYEAPTTIRSYIHNNERTKNHLHDYLDAVSKRVHFKKWYFGHYHIDRPLTRCYTAIYQKVVALGE
jgi:predicted phosphodiesterase